MTEKIIKENIEKKAFYAPKFKYLRHFLLKIVKIGAKIHADKVDDFSVKIQIDHFFHNFREL